MDLFLKSFATLKCRHFSDDELHFLLCDHPNADHVIAKYRQQSFADCLDRLDPRTAGMFFSNELLEHSCLPARYNEFRRWLDEAGKLDAWVAGVDGVEGGLIHQERETLLTNWHSEMDQYLTDPRYEVWETLAPRKSVVSRHVGDVGYVGR